MKTLLIGKNGRLGKEFISQLGAPNITAIGRETIDLTDAFHLRWYLRQHQPELVINCAAFNGMEACDERPDLAYAVNAEAPITIASVLRSYNGALIHFSTDYAVTGRGDQYRYHETDTGSPAGVYGMSKRQGEDGVIACGGNYLIFRVSSIYGDDLGGSVSPVRNFLAGKRDLGDNKVLRQCTTPTSVRLIARTVLKEILPRYRKAPSYHNGLYHLVPDGQTWKAEFGLRALNLYLDDGPSCGLLTGELAIERPVFSVLNNERIKNQFKITLPTVYEDLFESANLWRLKNNRQPLCNPPSPKPE